MRGLHDNPYAVLGVPRDASDDELRAAYHAAARAAHPDKGGDAAAMAALTAAWAQVSSPERRAATEARLRALGVGRCKSCRGTGLAKLRKGFSTVDTLCASCAGKGWVA